MVPIDAVWSVDASYSVFEAKNPLKKKVFILDDSGCPQLYLLPPFISLCLLMKLSCTTQQSVIANHHTSALHIYLHILVDKIIWVRVLYTWEIHACSMGDLLQKMRWYKQYQSIQTSDWMAEKQNSQMGWQRVWDDHLCLPGETFLGLILKAILLGNWDMLRCLQYFLHNSNSGLAHLDVHCLHGHQTN